jgi:arginyl-tRNA synthetase
MFDTELNTASSQILEQFRQLGFPQPMEVRWIPTPFRGAWGYGTPASFQSAAAEARENSDIIVPKRAQEIASAILESLGTPYGFSLAKAENGYINLYVETGIYASRLIQAVEDQGNRFGSGPENAGRVMVEYSQPNTHKAFHVGHLRNVILGGAMSNIFEFAGSETVRANYIGDIGWHVIKWLWGYLRSHADEHPPEDKTRWMQEIYSEAAANIEDHPQDEAEARELLKRWDERDPEIVALWEKTRQWSLEGFDQIYEVLGEQFDVVFYESEFQEPGKKVIDDLIERKLAIDERPDGPVVVKLDELLGLRKEKYRSLVVLRSDGTALYSTNELPLAIRKFEEWEIDRSVYVVDVRQSLYLQQLFKLLELMDFKQAAKCHHLSYELVNLPGDVTMSSRDGTVVIFDDFYKQALSRAREIVEQKNPALSDQEKENVSSIVALGALKYPMLSVDNNKPVTFEWERALDFEGQAAPYIQYAHVRACSILRKAGDISESPIPADMDFAPEEIELMGELALFPDEVQRAAEEFKPLHISNYCYNLARIFTSFYQQCPVLTAEDPVRFFRIRLTDAARQTLSNSLKLLGIEAPSVM